MSANQLATLPYIVDGWQWPDGAPFRLTLRALTFRERSAVYRTALQAGIKAGLQQLDEETWALETALAGIVEPKLTRAQIDILLDSNAHIIDKIVEQIERLGEYPPAIVAEELRRMAGVADPAAPA